MSEEKRSTDTRLLYALANVAHKAVEHVGIANYAEREREAHRWIEDALAKALRNVETQP